LNHIEKLKLRLEISSRIEISQNFVDADFIYKHCLPDSMENLIDFHFHISTKFEIAIDNIENILHSFRTHRCFIDHHWTNVNCYVHIRLRPSIHHLFHKFDQFFPNASCLQVWTDGEKRKLSFIDISRSFRFQYFPADIRMILRMN